MNNKITQPRLASLLAESTGETKKNCEDFLKAFFAVISESLAQGESVKAKGLGTFKVTRVEARKSVNVATGEEYTIPEHDKISFIPAKELASKVNAPFEFFETVELADSLTDSDLETEKTEEVFETEKTEKTEEVFETEKTEKIEEVFETEKTEKTEKEEEESASMEVTLPSVTPTSIPEPEPTPAPIPEPEPTPAPIPEPEPTPTPIAESSHRNSFGRGFLWGAIAAILVIALGLGIAYAFLLHQLTVSAPSEQTAKTEIVKSAHVPTTKPSADTIAKSEPAVKVAETIPSDAPAKEEKKAEEKKVYDTVSTTRYLGTMAKQHYGNYQFWSYIYEENKAFLGHPDRIRPGTKVVIPDLAKYGVDPKNPADIDKARRKGAAIYAKYRP